jgi:hypothetical protein
LHNRARIRDEMPRVQNCAISSRHLVKINA